MYVKTVVCVLFSNVRGHPLHPLTHTHTHTHTQALHNLGPCDEVVGCISVLKTCDSSALMELKEEQTADLTEISCYGTKMKINQG